MKNIMEKPVSVSQVIMQWIWNGGCMRHTTYNKISITFPISHKHIVSNMTGTLLIVGYMRASIHNTRRLLCNIYNGIIFPSLNPAKNFQFIFQWTESTKRSAVEPNHMHSDWYIAVHAICLSRATIHTPWTQKKDTHSLIEYQYMECLFTCLHELQNLKHVYRRQMRL